MAEKTCISVSEIEMESISGSFTSYWISRDLFSFIYVIFKTATFADYYVTLVT